MSTRPVRLGVMGWPATGAGVVLRALYRIGWTLKRQSDPYRVLARAGWSDHVFAFHEQGGDWAAHAGAHRQADGPAVGRPVAVEAMVQRVEDRLYPKLVGAVGLEPTAR